MKVKPIKNWKKAYKMHSIQIGFLAIMVASVQAELLPVIRPFLTDEQFNIVTLVVAFLAVFLRLVQQPGVDDDGGQDEHNSR
jgi:hypothetical protein